MQTPEIRYAQSGDVSIAYQRWGRRDGPVFTWFPFLLGNVEVEWEEPCTVHSLRRMGSFADVIHFDKRGSGLSDRMDGAPTLEQRVDDARAVLDAEGIERAYIGGMSEGGPLAILFAAMYPERVDGLVLTNTFAGASAAGFPRPLVELFQRMIKKRLDRLVEGWGTSDSYGTEFFAPSQVGNEPYERWMQRFERMSCSPQQIRRLLDLTLEMEVADALPSIQVPTLVIHCMGDDIVPFPAGREIAKRIPDARWVPVRARDHVWWVSAAADRVLDEIEAFVTGSRPAPKPTSRSLATVLFTDIVASTERVATVGDERWNELLDAHDGVTREHVERWGGRVVKQTGDGMLALFDSPGRALDCTLELRRALAIRDLEIRAGLHTGEVELRDDDVAGVAVHLARRVMEAADPGAVYASGTVKDLVIGTEHRFDEAGIHELKGIPGKRPLFRVLLDPVPA